MQLDDFTRIVIQFVFATLIGTFLTFIVQRCRDLEARRETRRESLRELIKELDALYRTEKQIRRMLRCFLQNGSSEIIISREMFEKYLTWLSDIQLALEGYAQMIRVRVDLFPNSRRMRRIRRAVRYIEAYLCKVVEEFEDGKIEHTGDQYLISEGAFLLKDFLASKSAEDNLLAAWPEDESAYKTAELFEILSRIVADKRAANRRRYRRVADQYFKLAIRDMREALIELDQNRGMLVLLRECFGIPPRPPEDTMIQPAVPAAVLTLPGAQRPPPSEAA